MKSLIRFLAVFSILLSAQFVSAQTTAFSYQGKLTDTGSPGNGSFQMQFKLFDSLGGTGQVGSTLADVPVTVTQGGFSVKLDFGASVFTGANRWLEVSVRRNSGESYTTLSPREQIASSPHSVRSLSSASAEGLSANCVNCVTSSQIQSLNGSQVTGTIPIMSVPTGSENYIQNASVALKNGGDGTQPAASLNIGGNATVGSMNVNGPLSMAAAADPGTSPVGQARLYFDSAANKFKISENGAAFVNLVGATGVSGSGTVNKLPFFSAATTLADSVITQAGTSIGIGTPSPSAKLTVAGAGVFNAPSAARFDLHNTAFGAGYLQHVLDNGTWQLATTNTALTRMAVNQAGNVGIGTGAPNAKLEVRGVGIHQRITDDTSGNSLVLQGGSGTNMKVTGYNYNTNTGVPLYLSVDGANTIISPNGGVVGVGTSTPHGGYRMDIFGGTRVHSPSAAHFVAETTGGTNSWARFYMRSSTRTWFIGTSQNFIGDQFYLADETSNQSRMTIQPNGGAISFPFGNVGIGTTNPTAKLDVFGTTRTGVLQITGGSDLAENFEIDSAESVKPGMIVAIDPLNVGRLTLSKGAYNRRVAGIVSGANGLAAGMILPDLKESDSSLPVALSGRAWVYADAKKHPIRAGDLLTTSDIPGHAMRVTKFKAANGAVIGKAMTDLRDGTGLVLVLVTLQ